jgi:hypothetical protein
MYQDALEHIRTTYPYVSMPLRCADSLQGGVVWRKRGVCVPHVVSPHVVSAARRWEPRR